VPVKFILAIAVKGRGMINSYGVATVALMWLMCWSLAGAQETDPEPGARKAQLEDLQKKVRQIPDATLSAPEKKAVDESLSDSVKELENIQKSAEKFKGLGFGVALSYTHDLGKRNRVVDASIVNGVVRVNEENNDIVRFMLETHYFFPFTSDHWYGDKGKGGWGPFVAFEPASDGGGPIRSIGAGIMFGWRRDKARSDSFNFGIGAIMDSSVKVLGDGVRENEPLPSGETEIRYKKTSQGGLLLLLSFAF